MIRFPFCPVWGCAWLGSLLLPDGFAGIFYKMVLQLLPDGIAGLSVRCSQKFSPYLQMQSSFLQKSCCSCSSSPSLVPVRSFCCSYFLEICFCLWRLPVRFVKYLYMCLTILGDEKEIMSCRWRNMAPSVHASFIRSMIRQSWRYCFDSVDKHGHIFLSHLQSGAIGSWVGLRNLESAFHGVGCSLDRIVSWDA